MHERVPGQPWQAARPARDREGLGDGRHRTPVVSRHSAPIATSDRRQLGVRGITATRSGVHELKALPNCPRQIAILERSRHAARLVTVSRNSGRARNAYARGEQSNRGRNQFRARRWARDIATSRSSSRRATCSPTPSTGRSEELRDKNRRSLGRGELLSRRGIDVAILGPVNVHRRPARRSEKELFR